MSDWKERAKELQRLQAEAKAAQEQPTVAFDPDLVPEAEHSDYQRTEIDDAIDQKIDSINVLDAYNIWCGKMHADAGGKRKNIMIRCPNPDHEDKIESASIDLDLDVWSCHGRCSPDGGDKFDLAAIRYGYPRPGYKEGKLFVQLRRQMGEDLGLPIVKSLSGAEYVAEIAPLEHPEPEHSGEPDGDADIVQFPMPGDFDDSFIEYPTIEWPTVCNPNGFLYDWMNVTKQDDLPEEFYFWLGLIALGFAVGRNAVLDDNPIVRGNLYVCLYGPTGQGKSRAIGTLNSLLYEALPYDHSDPMSAGTYMVPSPGSAEALVDAFSRPITDDSDPKAPIIGYGHVRGLVRFDELSTLIGRASRMGNPMKPMLMEFFDGYAPIEHKTRGMGHTRAEGYFCSTLTTTQPRAIRDLLVQTDVDSGFVNRWIFAAGPGKKRVSIGRKKMDIASCVDPLRAVRAWAGSSRIVGLTTGALERWDDFFHDELLPQQTEEESGLLARADLTLKKIMLLLAADRKINSVDLEVVEDTLRIWEYLHKSYRMLSGEIGMGPFEDVRQAVRVAMVGFEVRYKKPPTMRKIARLIARKKVPGDILVRVMKAMIELTEVEEIKPGTVASAKAGRPTMRYHYVV